MKPLLTQCALAAFAAAVVSASVSMAQDSRPGIGAQIEALGLDRAEVRAKLEGLSRDERIAYLQSLGVQLQIGAARPDTAFTPGTALKVNPDAANGTAVVTPLPASADDKFTILPWTGPINDISVDGGSTGDVTVRPLPVRPGSVSNGSVSSGGAVVIDPAAVSGVGSFTPAQLPAKP